MYLCFPLGKVKCIFSREYEMPLNFGVPKNLLLKCEKKIFLQKMYTF